MKKYLLTVMMICAAAFLAAGAGAFSSRRTELPVSASVPSVAAAVNDEAPRDLTELRNADKSRLDRWASGLEIFDGREYDYITPARNQGKKNICWVYSAIGAVEANILRNGIDAAATKETLDLDEVVTAYARYNRDGSEDPLGLTANDTYSRDDWNVGGNALDAFSIMTQGYCLADNDATIGPYTSPDIIKSKMGASEYYIKDYMFVENDIAAIKRAVMEYGAVTINYKKPPLKRTYIYDDDKSTIDHSSLIVGWDDTIDKGLFYPAKPTQNGAWIVKNSWGSYGNTVNDVSCFYLSYESNINDNIFAVNVAPRADYRNIYFYDGKLTDKTPSVTADAQAAVYKAQLSDDSTRELLTAVAVGTAQSADANIKIYKSPTADSGNIGDELSRLDAMAPVAELDASLFGRGMHTVDLPAPIGVGKDEYCFIIMRLAGEDGSAVAVTCADDDAASVNDMTYYLYGGSWVSHKTENMTARIRLITNVTERTIKDIGSIDVTLERYDFEYDGMEKTPAVIARDGERALTSGEDFEVAYYENTDAGQGKAIVSGKNDYTGTVELIFTIERANVKDFVVSLDDWTYGDEAAPEPTASGARENAEVTYLYSTAENGDYDGVKPSAAGSYWVKAVAAQTKNYNAAEAKARFTIRKAARPKAETTLNVSGWFESLSEVEPPENFAWVEGSLSIVSETEMTAKAVYIGADADCYETTELTFNIIVESRGPEQEKEPGQTPEQKPEQQPEQEQTPEQTPEQGPEPETEYAKRGNLVRAAIVVSAAVIVLAGAAAALVAYRRRKR